MSKARQFVRELHRMPADWKTMSREEVAEWMEGNFDRMEKLFNEAVDERVAAVLKEVRN